jgi:YggT family protein
LSLVFEILAVVLLVFWLMLLARLVFDLVQAFARDWRPRGPLLIVLELIYTVTDPPLKAIRRVIPPLRLGQIQLDLDRHQHPDQHRPLPRRDHRLIREDPCP